MTFKIENVWLGGDQSYDNWGSIGASPPGQAVQFGIYGQQSFDVIRSLEAASLAARQAEEQAEAKKLRLARPGKIAWRRRRLRRAA